jgi:hypothetical protein
VTFLQQLQSRQITMLPRVTLLLPIIWVFESASTPLTGFDFFVMPTYAMHQNGSSTDTLSIRNTRAQKTSRDVELLQHERAPVRTHCIKDLVLAVPPPGSVRVISLWGSQESSLAAGAKWMC